MEFSTGVIADFAVIMSVGGLATFIFHRLKQPLILGYLIAGIVIGPYTPPFSFINQPEVLEAAAELGVILLLFGIGLEFPGEAPQDWAQNVRRYLGHRDRVDVYPQFLHRLAS